MSVKLTSLEIAFLTYEQRVQYFLDRAREVHGDRYSYENMNYVKNKEKINIECSKHGIFTQTPHDHLKGRGCPDCGGKKKSNTKEFIEKARKVHGDLYNYSKTIYTKAMDTVEIVCKTHGLFTQRGDSHLNGAGCPSCLHRQSKPELELIALLMDKYPDIEIKSSITPEWFEGKREIDIYIPSKNLAIEYNGDYWHSEKFGRDREWHERKSNEAKSAGVTLLHIWDSRWNSDYKDIYLEVIDKFIKGNGEEVMGVVNDNIWIK